MKAVAASLTKKERKALREFIANLERILPNRIERVLLFGSRARGTGGTRSDTDVALVVRGERTPGLRTAVAEACFGPIANSGVGLSPFLIPASAFREGSPFIQRIKEEGVALWTQRRNSLAAA